MTKEDKKPLIVYLILPEKRRKNSEVEKIEHFMIFVSEIACDIATKARSCDTRYAKTTNIRMSKETFDKWCSNIPVRVAVMVQPPHREINRRANKTVIDMKKLTIIGTGTLGSNLFELFLRKGVSEELVIVDFDLYSSSNVARHVLEPSRIMQSKASALKHQFRGVEDQKISAIDKNFLHLNKAELERALKDTELIVDVSTSVSVERRLAIDTYPTNCRRCTIFLNPKGTDLVILMEDSQRRNRLDLLEMNYLRAILTEESLANHLEKTEVMNTNNFSCRSESVLLDYDDVRILSSIASKQIIAALGSQEAMLTVWQLDTNTCLTNPINISTPVWHEFKVGVISVFVSEEVIADIKEACDQKRPQETGGCIFGCYDNDHKAIYVLFAGHAPEDSIHTPNSFIRGSKGMAELNDFIAEKTFKQVRYIGEWHTHPDQPNTPSQDDKHQFEVMSKDWNYSDSPFVQMIYGSNGLYVNASM